MARTNSINSAVPQAVNWLSADMRANMAVLKASDERVYDVVAHYGADNTGAAGGQAALINAAIADAIVVGYGYIIIPPGVYKCDDDEVKLAKDAAGNIQNIHIFGYGAKIVSSAPSQIFRIGNTEDGGTMGQTLNCTVNGLWLYTNNATTNRGVVINGEGTSGNILRDCRIHAEAGLNASGDNSTGLVVIGKGSPSATYYNRGYNLEIEGWDKAISTGTDHVSGSGVYASDSAPNGLKLHDLIIRNFYTHGWYVNSGYNELSGDINGQTGAGGIDIELTAMGELSTSNLFLESGGNQGIVIASGSSGNTWNYWASGTYAGGRFIDNNTVVAEDTGDKFQSSSNLVIEANNSTQGPLVSAKTLRANFLRILGGDDLEIWGAAGFATVWKNILTNASTIGITNLGALYHTPTFWAGDDTTPTASTSNVCFTASDHTTARNIDTIDGGIAGQRLTIIARTLDDPAKGSTFRDGVGNLILNGSWSDAIPGTSLSLVYDGLLSKWGEEGRSTATRNAKYVELTSSGAISAGLEHVDLNHTTVAIAATIADASKHYGVFKVVASTEPGAGQDHTVTLTSGTWNGTNNVATFVGINDALVVFFDRNGRGSIIENIGAVVLS